MKQKVLITGASGFVGFHLIEAALAKGLDVYAGVRRSSNIDHLSSYPIHFTYPDFSSIDALAKELQEKQYSFIIHAAGTTKARNQEDYNKINASFAFNLATAAAKVGSIQKMVFISSIAALGSAKPPNETLNESTTPVPATAYGKSKLLAEERIKDLALPLIILRPTAVYGARDKDVFIIIKTFAKGLEPYIGKIAQRLSFIYVKDLAAVTIDALFAEDSANGAYNITDGNCYSRYDMADIVKNILSRRTVKFHLPLSMVSGLAWGLEKAFGIFNKTPVLNVEKLADLTAENWCCEIEKARTKLNFSPAYDLQQGLKETLEWYKANKWL